MGTIMKMNPYDDRIQNGMLVNPKQLRAELRICESLYINKAAGSYYYVRHTRCLITPLFGIVSPIPIPQNKNIEHKEFLIRVN